MTATIWSHRTANGGYPSRRKHRVLRFRLHLKGILLLLSVLAAAVACAGENPPPPGASALLTNGLGMRFVPIKGSNALLSIYQTRVKDYRVFIRESGYVHMRETTGSHSRMWSLDHDGNKQRGHSWENPGFAQTEDHPVVGVSWYDAKAFCEWLTARERAAGRLPANREYRLPTDAEWSVAVGLDEEDPKKTPEEKDSQIKDKYPWGTDYPPPAQAGNYAGTEANDGHWPAVSRPFPDTTMAFHALPQSARSSQTDMASTTWAATSSNGVRINTAPASPSE